APLVTLPLDGEDRLAALDQARVVNRHQPRIHLYPLTAHITASSKRYVVPKVLTICTDASPETFTRYRPPATPIVPWHSSANRAQRSSSPHRADPRARPNPRSS